MAKKPSKLKKQIKKASEVNPHKSFKRTYREDYLRDTDMPGIMYHILNSFHLFFKHWKLFLPLTVIAVVLSLAFVGLSGESNEASIMFGAFIFLIIWLTTIFLLRHIMAGHKVTLRDGLYNAMTPLLSTFVVFVVAVIQCIPIFVLIILYSAAVRTDFLTMPFYALLFLVVAGLLILLSAYLLSSSLMALIAVSAPGLYPLKALSIASELMIGRRVKFVIRLIALLLTMAIMWAAIMLPLILFDRWMKTFEWAVGIPFIPICVTIMTCFSSVYLTIYLYTYYRWLLKS